MSQADTAPPAPKKRSFRRRVKKFFSKNLVALAVRLIPPVYVFYMNFVWRTSQVEQSGVRRYQRARLLHEGAIGALWHETVFFVAYAFREFHPSTLASKSDFGQLIANLLRLCNFHVFRGGSSRAGKSRKTIVLPELLGHLTSHRLVAMGITVDGSHGPARVMKRGTVELARATGYPLFGVHIASSPSLSAPSWDRTRIPLPFSRIKMLFEGPMFVPVNASAADFERHVARAQELLRDTVRRVDAWLATGALPPPAEEFAAEYGAWEVVRGPRFLRPDEILRPSPRELG